ncbi:molybdopterin-dependent oxidoreductase [Pseudonocardia sp. TRM90224]|uniref:molybdopterin-dependent oxidoreductase n=1 Tax=Pseudonocardia sp. TRM90224 TaxID=2812678 RepID=UPI001E2A2BEC|nr:molybdopterin-dependent oxidoreductase [Pseudonocardia sp. TRM90224]
MTDERTSYRICPLCEATCGLVITTRGERVVSVRGDTEDEFSRGFACPKGIALGELHHDPDRLTTPLIRRNGELVPATFEEAFAEIAARLPKLIEEHGRNAVAVYLGNPVAHDHAALLYAPMLIKALGTDHRYSASTVDQMPKHLAVGLMFGTVMSVPIPDVDRTDHLLVLGANPLVSNGSLFTAPDMPGRLRALRKRGGRLVVVDPRRTRTAKAADEHVTIRPGTDALLLAAMAHTLFAEGLVTLGRLAPHVSGLDDVREIVAAYPPETVAQACGVPAADIRRLARELAAAPSAAVYGRIGTCTTAHGTLASWLVDVLNVLTGNLDRPGGALFTKPAARTDNTAGEPGRGRGVRVGGPRRTRVRGLPSVLGEFPAATLAEEIDTPGPGGERIRALVTVAGNPALSTPNGARLEAALGQLDFMVCIDAYLNETTRHADVVLPAPSPLTRSQYDLPFAQFSTRNVAHWSPPVFPPSDGRPSDGELILRLAAIMLGTTAEALDDLVVQRTAAAAAADPSSPLHGRDPAELVAELGERRGADRMLDLMLRAGPYDLTLDDLAAAPHGVDLGPLQPRIPEVLRTPSGTIELAPQPIVDDAPRLADLLTSTAGLTLVGRRDLRSNNSWMHNLPAMVKGADRCTLHISPSDAVAAGIVDGGRATVTSRVGAVEVTVLVTDDVRPGVVSLPHGWGHAETGMSVARAHAGVNSNLLTDELEIDPLSGNAVLNGIPVTVTPAGATEPTRPTRSVVAAGSGKPLS